MDFNWTVWSYETEMIFIESWSNSVDTWYPHKIRRSNCSVFPPSRSSPKFNIFEARGETKRDQIFWSKWIYANENPKDLNKLAAQTIEMKTDDEPNEWSPLISFFKDSHLRMFKMLNFMTFSETNFHRWDVGKHWNRGEMSHSAANNWAAFIKLQCPAWMTSKWRWRLGQGWAEVAETQFSHITFLSHLINTFDNLRFILFT